MAEQKDYLKGLALGTFIGGVAGAITALLLAPKSGAELRKDISTKSGEVYGKATDYVADVEKKVEATAAKVVDTVSTKTKSIIDSFKKNEGQFEEEVEAELKKK
ncbi:MAG: YtxH domain-containing protein [bacterium]